MKAKILAACGGLLLMTLFAAAPAKTGHVSVEVAGVPQWRKPVDKVVATGHRCFKALSESVTEVFHDGAACKNSSRPSN